MSSSHTPPSSIATPTGSCTSTGKRLGNASPSTSVICKEVFDETCQPSADEISDYALLLGIDPAKEPHLLYLAKEGLMQALPAEWKICYSEEKCGHYYYNTKTKQSQWDHPLDAVYRELVDQARHPAGPAAGKQAPTPTIVDNSEDASQLDSGIRSLLGNDDCDTTQNTNEMSSPISNIVANGKLPAPSSGSSTSNSTSTSGFSGGVSRFLESRSKNFAPNFQPVKNTRFEVAKTNLQIGLAMKFGSDVFGQKLSFPLKADPESAGAGEKKGFSLTGSGSMFLKSRRQMEVGLNQASAAMMAGPANHIVVESSVGTPPGMKGILRDSSLTDMRRRLEKDDTDGACHSANGESDKKSVRFNLDEMAKMRGSPEEDASSSRRLTQSPEVSVNSDEDAEDDDPWDEDDEDVLDGCVGIGSLQVDSVPTTTGYQRSLNPFLVNDEKLKEIKVIPVAKAQTIQMLKAQSFSIDLPERDRSKLCEQARSQSVDVSGVGQLSAVSYLEKLKESSAAVKPLYEDTDSDSKGSSVRSFIINKSEQESLHSSAGHPTNPFDLDELGRKHSRDVQQLEAKLQSSSISERSALRNVKVSPKHGGLLLKHDREAGPERPAGLKEERERLEEQLQNEIDLIKREHEQKLKNIRHEYDLRLTSHQHQLDEAADLQLDEYRERLEQELAVKRKAVVDGHKAQMATLQQNHSEILQDLERDLKSEAEILKKEHAAKLADMRDKLGRELELERQRMRDTGEDRLYEKVRCEKRLLEDKYRCLKEKYVRLKTDVKLSLERRNRRREAQALHQQSLHTNTTTGSETERSLSNKPSIGNSENRSLTLSTSCHEAKGGMPMGKGGMKPPVPPKTHLSAVSKDLARERQSEQRSPQGGTTPRKPGLTSKYIKHLQVQDDTASLSQSDTTISNNYPQGRYLPVPPAVVSDNGNSDSEALQGNQENNNNSSRGSTPRKKLFSRMKSASTSRLNSDNNYKNERPCTPVESLRHQLQKLEDLEDQFPDNTLDSTYHLRYPFSDISNDHAGASSELEFFKHRIHLERDSVRRAKESLRSQRTNFRSRQREIKQRHKAPVPRHSVDQAVQEEKELTEMEVNLHRTRALLGEKVIRLRHLEQSLLRIYEKEKPPLELLGVEQKDDATLSDLSSHSSSGFSSTDFASGDTQNLHKRKDTFHQESSECIQNLEILNAEIREILDLLGKQQHAGMGVPLISPTELNWSHMLSTGNSGTLTQTTIHHNPQASPSSASALLHAPQSIPTLADRLETTYRQLATGRMQNSMGGAILAANTIVSQSPRALNYTTSLVERTRDLRNWLRQAKNEHELLAGMTTQTSALAMTAGGATGMAAAAASSSAAASFSGVGGGGGGSGAQANL